MNVCWPINAFIDQYSDHWQTDHLVRCQVKVFSIAAFILQQSRMPRKTICSESRFEFCSHDACLLTSNIENSIAILIISLSLIHFIYRAETDFLSSSFIARNRMKSPFCVAVSFLVTDGHLR